MTDPEREAREWEMQWKLVGMHDIGCRCPICERTRDDTATAIRAAADRATQAEQRVVNLQTAVEEVSTIAQRETKRADAAEQECAQAKAREAQLRAALERLTTAVFANVRRDPAPSWAVGAVAGAEQALVATPDEPLRVVRELMAQVTRHLDQDDCPELRDALAAAARLFGPETSR